MVRWGQTSISADALQVAKSVFRPDLFDAALGTNPVWINVVADGIGAFAGPAFDPNDIPSHLSAFAIKREPAR